MAVLEHIPRNVEEVDDIFTHSQVIVMTSSIAGQCKPAVQDRWPTIVPTCSLTKRIMRRHRPGVLSRSDSKRRVVQFTATPFREDGKPLDGEIIFKYPLKKAQQEGYFKSIRFRPVVEFNRKRSDAAIARKAIEQLRADADKGHILMARVDSVARAEDVFKLYQAHARVQPGAAPHGINRRKNERRFGGKLSAESRGSSSASTCLARASTCPS